MKPRRNRPLAPETDAPEPTPKARRGLLRRAAPGPRDPRRWLRMRIAVLGVLLLTGASFVGARAYELQVDRAPALREMAEDQYLRRIRLAPKRGTIYDRHGAELAVSVDADSVWANPRELRAAEADPAYVTRRLVELLDVDPERIERRLRSDRYFVWIKRRVTPRMAERIREAELPGVHIDREARRYYPNRTLASHLLGFANIDGVGIEGLELSMEERLRGAVRSVPAIRDRAGRVVFSEQLLDRSNQGEDVALTIDATIQRVAERELELAVRTYEARAGSVVVMDPESGELLAVASYPSFDPNRPGSSPASHRRNRAVTDRFEPGSTVKPFTVAAALARGHLRPEEQIDCENGRMQVGEDDVIRDTSPHELLTPAQCLAYSSNICVSKIGNRMGRRGLYRAFRSFGFGQTTELPLPGETRGSLRHFREWFEMDAATIPFGQAMSTTNVQIATAMAAVANGGRLLEPVLLRRVGAEELPVRQVRRRVVPERTARLVADMLTAVTGPDGTAPQAAIDGYLVAGKTGTAQKADHVHGGYAADRWVASFAGFVPARSPRLVISVVIDEPIVAYYGGVVAGPVFRRVGEAALRHLGVPAATGGEALAEHTREERRRRRQLAQAEREAEAPDADADLVLPLAEGEVRVPELEGRTARAALVTLRELGLRAVLTGSGQVHTQLPVAGQPIPRGETVHLTLRPPAEVRAEAERAAPALAQLASVAAPPGDATDETEAP